jgi:hypothetical protein
LEFHRIADALMAIGVGLSCYLAFPRLEFGVMVPVESGVAIGGAYATPRTGLVGVRWTDFKTAKIWGQEDR